MKHLKIFGRGLVALFVILSILILFFISVFVPAIKGHESGNVFWLLLYVPHVIVLIYILGME